MRAEVPADPGRLAGAVRLTAPESLCAYRLPALLSALRPQAPEVQLSLAPGGTAAALEAVRNATTDLALLLEPTLTAACSPPGSRPPAAPASAASRPPSNASQPDSAGPCCPPPPPPPNCRREPSSPCPDRHWPTAPSTSPPIQNAP